MASSLSCVVISLFGLNLHVNGLENLFLCLKKFAINAFNANDFLLLEQKEINILDKKSKNGYHIFLFNILNRV